VGGVHGQWAVGAGVRGDVGGWGRVTLLGGRQQGAGKREGSSGKDAACTREVLERARLLEAKVWIEGVGLLVPGPRQKRGRVQGRPKGWGLGQECVRVGCVV
jgi:hypothetical protein